MFDTNWEKLYLEVANDSQVIVSGVMGIMVLYTIMAQSKSVYSGTDLTYFTCVLISSFHSLFVFVGSLLVVFTVMFTDFDSLDIVFKQQNDAKVFNISDEWITYIFFVRYLYRVCVSWSVAYCCINLIVFIIPGLFGYKQTRKLKVCDSIDNSDDSSSNPNSNEKIRKNANETNAKNPDPNVSNETNNGSSNDNSHKLFYFCNFLTHILLIICQWPMAMTFRPLINSDALFVSGLCYFTELTNIGYFLCNLGRLLIDASFFKRGINIMIYTFPFAKMVCVPFCIYFIFTSNNIYYEFGFQYWYCLLMYQIFNFVSSAIYAIYFSFTNSSKSLENEFNKIMELERKEWEERQRQETEDLQEKMRTELLSKGPKVIKKRGKRKSKLRKRK